MRILIYILLAICSVACMAGVTDPGPQEPNPEPAPGDPTKPVQPVMKIIFFNLFCCD